jgi:membrane associated rhomboid family serine protease
MTKWVSILIGANVGIWLLQQGFPWITQTFWLVPAHVLQTPWTLVTYMFLHDPNGLAHVGFNMLALYIFGPRLETVLGGSRFITLYLLSGIGGGLLSFMPPYYYTPIIGASGAIFGVTTAYARLWPRDRLYIWGILPVQVWLLVAIYVGYSMVGALNRNVGAGTAHLGHLGGIVVGWVYMSWLRQQSGATRFKKNTVAPPVASDGDAQKRWGTIRLDDLHPINRGEVVRLLQKVQTSGTRSLSPEERATLDRFSLTS